MRQDFNADHIPNSASTRLLVSEICNHNIKRIINHSLIERLLSITGSPYEVGVLVGNTFVWGK